MSLCAGSKIGHLYTFAQFLAGEETARIYALRVCRHCGETFILGSDEKWHEMAEGIPWDQFTKQLPPNGPYLQFKR